MKQTMLNLIAVGGVVLAGAAWATEPAATAVKPPIAADQPIEINADGLDVFQAEHKAVFTGNVIAKQGTTTMRAAKMIVFYHDDAPKKPLPEAGAAPVPAKTDAAGQGIYKIEAYEHVIFTTPAETAQGDVAVYDVDAETIDLVGKGVTLVRDKNVLKGTKLNYNMATGRSILTAGAVARDANGVPVKTPRVQGLFVPKPKDEAAGKK